MTQAVIDYRLSKVNGGVGLPTTIIGNFGSFPFATFQLGISNLLGTLAPFLMVLGYLGLVSKASSVFVEEKETRVREGVIVL